MSAASAGRRVVVVGGGVAGLATAGLLARDGHRVTLLEQGDDLGGRAGRWEHDGFVFDTGPSWWLMPEVFDHWFAMMGSSTAAEVDLVTLDPGYRVWTEGDTEPLEVVADPAGNLALFERTEPGGAAALQRYLRSAREVYDLALRHFLYTSFESPRTLLAPAVVRSAPRLVGQLTRSLESYAASRFRDRRLRQVLGYPAVFLGSSPDRAPAIYHMMSHLDLVDGVRYPMGGFGSLVDAMARLARDAGAELTTGATVTRIETAATGRRRRRARVTGVTYRDHEGEHTLDADVVVGAADLHHVETALLPETLRTYPESWWDRVESGPGAVLVHLGVTGELPELAHHSLFFTADWRANFDAIFGADTRVPEPASIYVCRPSATDPSVAPQGHENLFVLVPVPADPSIGRGGTDGSGEVQVERAADAAIDLVADWAGVPDLRERVVVRRTVGPGDFVVDLNAWRGGALGPAHVLRQSALFRAGNVSRKVEGLHYAGHGTIPGIGLPMCLISAELVLKRLRGDRSVGPCPEPAGSASSVASHR